MFDYPSADAIAEYVLTLLPAAPAPQPAGTTAASPAHGTMHILAVPGAQGSRAVTGVPARLRYVTCCRKGQQKNTAGVVPDSVHSISRSDVPPPKIAPAGGAIARGAASQREHKPGRPAQLPANPDAPRLTREGYYTVPPGKVLRRLDDDALAAVPRFVVGREDTGEVQFLQVCVLFPAASAATPLKINSYQSASQPTRTSLC